jgi:hypothetical protein
MNYDKEVFDTVYPLLRGFILHYCAFKQLETHDDMSGDEEFWICTNNAHYQMAVVTWCMIFGTDKNDTHWKNIISNFEQDKVAVENDFRDYLLNEYGISHQDWRQYHMQMINFRNKYIVHRSLEEDWGPAPYLDDAANAAMALDEWFRKNTKISKAPDKTIYTDMTKTKIIERYKEDYMEAFRDTLDQIKSK